MFYFNGFGLESLLVSLTALIRSGTPDLTPERESTVFPAQKFSFAAYKFKPGLFEAFHCAVNKPGSEKQEPSVFCNM